MKPKNMDYQKEIEKTAKYRYKPIPCKHETTGLTTRMSVISTNGYLIL